MPDNHLHPAHARNALAKLPEGPDWEYEVKWDGYRIPAHLAELWDGIAPDEAVRQWWAHYRPSPPSKNSVD